MDYPKSVPNVGLVDGQFADENPATGQVGSLIPSAWGNAVTQELLNVIKAAGFAPAEGQTNQLLKAIQGLVSQGIKNSVRVATTGAIALSGVQTIDAIVLVAGDRVLVKNQASGAQNGIYVVAAGAWVRALDADESVEVKPGMLVGVDAGTVNGGSVWRLSNATPPTLGATALTFEQVFGKTGVVAGSYKSVTVGTDGRVTGGTNPTTLAGFGITDAFTKAESNAAMQAAIAALVGSAPSSLDVLSELAAALGNDPNFATTMLNLLAGKANKGTTLAEYGITDAVKFADKALEVDAAGGVNNAKWVTPVGVSVALSAAFAGCVTHFARNTAPGGWLKANGALVSRTAYSRLFSAIGTTFGAGDGVTTFALPDLRGEFVRGWDDSRGVDSGRALGSLQADELKSHIHTVPADTGWVYSAGSSSNAKPQQSGSSSISTGSTGGTETRPRNMALLACIKY
ncbi:tail fiber protein [Pseudomonas defluvii]|uniref:tail fiber protein n=1 Tax=Pseudomonas defluvii TaxID=1876757 RepID=UPI00081162FE|nr:tail fiber protein [Pseudomonas defluvii]